ncbi:MAG: hypothetical protein ACE5I7_18260 [Candidatus Binatia bacterium]
MMTQVLVTREAEVDDAHLPALVGDRRRAAHGLQVLRRMPAASLGVG